MPAGMTDSLPDPDPKPLDHLTRRGRADDVALVLKTGDLTYTVLDERVGRMAAWLAGHADKGDRIASWAAKGELTCLLPLAAARAEMVHVPINPLLKRAQAAHILADSGATVLIATASRLATLDGDDVPPSCATLSETDCLDEIVAMPGSSPASNHDPDELAAILYTSGSTGKPKGVMLSHANMWLGAVSVAHYLKLSRKDRTLAVLPLSFDYGQSQLLSTWYAGGRVVPLDYLFPRDVVKACERHAITTLAAVPPLWIQLCEAEWSDAARNGLQRLTNSGGALTQSLVTRLRTLFPKARLYPMYGLTEAFRSTFLDPALADAHPTSMGRAIPFAEILVIDDDGAPCRDGEEGELVHCGPLVAQGYWRDAGRTAERFRPAPAASKYGGTAVWSGDRVVRDDGGLLYFVGRRDAMIKSSGNRISPHEIEEAALATDLVSEAVAIGIPHETFGDAIHLIVRGTNGGEATDTLAKALASELPRFMQPHAIHWRSEIPRNPNGKTDRVALAAEIAG